MPIDKLFLFLHSFHIHIVVVHFFQKWHHSKKINKKISEIVRFRFSPCHLSFWWLFWQKVFASERHPLHSQSLSSTPQLEGWLREWCRKPDPLTTASSTVSAQLVTKTNNDMLSLLFNSGDFIAEINIHTTTTAHHQEVHIYCCLRLSFYFGIRNGLKWVKVRSWKLVWMCFIQNLVKHQAVWKNKRQRKIIHTCHMIYN